MIRWWWIVWGLSLATGCAHTAKGILSSTAGGVVVQGLHGEQAKLVLGPKAQPLGALEGYYVEVRGLKGLGALQVESWSVVEGPSALPVWVGPLEVLGARVGLRDHNSGGFYFLDQSTAEALRNQGGKWVVVEGYVDGPHEIRVMFHRLLDPTL